MDLKSYICLHLKQKNTEEAVTAHKLATDRAQTSTLSPASPAVPALQPWADWEYPYSSECIQSSFVQMCTSSRSCWNRSCTIHSDFNPRIAKRQVRDLQIEKLRQ